MILQLSLQKRWDVPVAVIRLCEAPLKQTFIFLFVWTWGRHSIPNYPKTWVNPCWVVTHLAKCLPLRKVGPPLKHSKEKGEIIWDNVLLLTGIPTPGSIFYSFMTLHAVMNYSEKCTFSFSPSSFHPKHSFPNTWEFLNLPLNHLSSPYLVYPVGWPPWLNLTKSTWLSPCPSSRQLERFIDCLLWSFSFKLQ